MKLKNLRLNLSNVARTTNSKTMPVNETGVIFATDDEGNFTKDIAGYTVSCSAYHGDEIKIKFPSSVKPKIDELNERLENDLEISISFTGLKLKAYAMKGTSGNIISGISASADDFEIVDTAEDEILL